MNDLLPNEWCDRLRAWAASKPIIRRAWCFGGRIVGHSNNDSDLDFAVDIDVDPRDDNHDDSWLRFKQSWKRELDSILPVEVDLVHWHPCGVNRIVQEGVQSSGRLIYERGRTRPLE
jgi:predicted nucleotidyltransferase